jgi:hypothetical protein
MFSGHEACSVSPAPDRPWGMATPTGHILSTSSWRSGRCPRWYSSEFFRPGLGRLGEMGVSSTAPGSSPRSAMVYEMYLRICDVFAALSNGVSSNCPSRAELRIARCELQGGAWAGVADQSPFVPRARTRRRVPHSSSVRITSLLSGDDCILQAPQCRAPGDSIRPPGESCPARGSRPGSR